jgi:hypothetical protein
MLQQIFRNFAPQYVLYLGEQEVIRFTSLRDQIRCKILTYEYVCVVHYRGVPRRAPPPPARPPRRQVLSDAALARLEPEALLTCARAAVRPTPPPLLIQHTSHHIKGLIRE